MINLQEHEMWCTKGCDLHVRGFNTASITITFWGLFSLLCLQRVLYEDMPTKFFFDLLQETDQEFVDRTGWFYQHDQPLYVPNPCVLIQPPHLPEGSRPYSPATPSVFPAPLPSPNQHWVYHRSVTLIQWPDVNNSFVLDSYIGFMIPRRFVVLWRVRFNILEESRRIQSMDIYRSFLSRLLILQCRSFYVLLSYQLIIKKNIMYGHL